MLWSFFLHDVLPADPLDTAAFRRLMGQYATGVCVVSAPATVDGMDNAIAGITVNSFVSVSLDPLLVAWSLGNASSQFDLWTKAPAFAISILAQDQQDLARRYAVRGSRELDRADFESTQNGLPVIAGALGYLECRHWSLYPAGDHTMVFGEVTGMRQAANGRPLTFFGGAFGKVAD
ncbi:MAG: flavin reductase family protein [Pseudomonadota bacterium]